MKEEIQVPLYDFIACLSNAVDLINPDVVNHHKRVAYIAVSIASEVGLSTEEQSNLILAALLHDSGAFSLKDRLDDLRFEFEFESRDPHKHACLGYLLLKKFKILSNAANLVRYHHDFWDERGGPGLEGEVPMGSHILHLADRVDILINRRKHILSQVKGIFKRIEEYSGKMFAPHLVEAFKNLASKEYFWFDAISPSVNSNFACRLGMPTIMLNPEELLSLAKLFCQVIDFRSRFTAAHSSRVAASADALARFINFSERECKMMKIAGYLHDLGKLAVPPEILEKSAKLTEDEFNNIKSHPFYTYRILETMGGLDTVNTWASFHHERLNGEGYPFHHKGEDLSLGSRIMAVADVFTAITEDRSYRKGMVREEALQVLRQMAENSALDSNIVSMLELHYDEVKSICMAAQAVVSDECQELEQQTG